MKRVLLLTALMALMAVLPGIACAAQQNLNYTTKTDWKTEGPKVQNNFTELYTNKANALGADDNYVTDAEKVKLINLSGTNTGDQDLSGYALTSSVLAKTNTTSYAPTTDYHPATKKYVDDSITAGGGYTDEQAQDAVGGMFSGNTETGITVTYSDTTGKVDFVVATQSDVNFTSTLNTKLAGIATGAEVNVNADWNSSSGDSQILNKPSTSPLTVSMITGLFTGTEDCLGSNGETVACGGSGGGTWGSITGTLSDQTDLQAALEAISAGGIPHVSSGYPSTSGAWNYNTTDNRLYTRKSNGDVYYTSALTLAAAADVTPAAFTFADVTDAELSTEYTRCVQITDIDWPANVTASSPAAAVCTGDNTGCGTFGTSPGTVANNGWVCARHTSSASNSTPTNTAVTVGTASDTFTTTTAAASGLTPTFYFNANSATSGQAPTIGTGTVTIGAGTAAVTGVVGNALEIDSSWGGSLNFPGAGNTSATIGTLGFYIYSANYVQNGSYVSRASMSSPYFLLEAGATTQWRYMSGGVQDLGLTNSTWSFVELSWDYANGRKAYRINGGTWQEVTGLTGSAPTINDVVFGSVDGNVTSFRIDQIIITSGYQDDVYSVRDNTSF